MLPHQTDAWTKLQARARSETPQILALFDAEPDRLSRLSPEVHGIRFDLSKLPLSAAHFSALEALAGRPWPGNIRELAHYAERVALSMDSRAFGAHRQRTEMTDEMQALCFFAGANSIFVGETLLTAGNPDEDKDMQLLAKLGMAPMVAWEHAPAPAEVQLPEAAPAECPLRAAQAAGAVQERPVPILR